MPTETTRRGVLRWRAVVKRGGRVVASKWFGSGPKEERKAIVWEEQVKRELARGQTTICEPELKLLAWAVPYLEDAKRRCTTGTFKEKRSAMQRLIERCGDSTLAGLTLPVARDFLDHEYDQRSGYAANRDRKNLAAAWTWGRKYLPGFPAQPNPFEAVERYPEERSDRYIPPMDDFELVLDVATGQDRVMLLTFFHLGARRGEVFRLTWADVDFKAGVVQLKTRKTRDGSWRLDPIPMSSDLRAVLLEWWEARPYKQAAHVFTQLDDSPSPNHKAGGPYQYRQKFMRSICKRAGVKPFGFHAIRHLSAVTLAKEGQRLSKIQKILRHQSPSTTERYLRSLGYDLEELREAVEVFSGRGQAKILPFAKNTNPQSGNSGGSEYPAGVSTGFPNG